MTGIRNVFRLAALGSALAWSGAGWAQQDSDKPSQDDKVQRKSDAGREKKSRRPGRPTIKPPAEDSFKQQAEDFNDQLRRLTRDRLRKGFELDAPPFHFNLRGDWYLSDPRSNDLGATIVPADESLRTQLGLSDGQGLIVKQVAPGGPASRIGLKVNDVLTTLNDKPLATPADLVKQLKEAGEKPVPLQVLRSGKSMTIRVKPEFHVTFGPVEESRPRYQLGVQVAALDDTLRAQLKLPDREGLLVNAVEPGSAAEKAGFKKHDILLAVGDQSLRGPEDLVNQIEKSSGKALTFKLLRGGKTITLEVTPGIKPDSEEGSLELGLEPSLRAIFIDRNVGQPLTLPPSVAYDPLWRQQTGNFKNGQPITLPFPSQRQLGDLRGEVMELRRSIEQLQRSLQTNSDSSNRPER